MAVGAQENAFLHLGTTLSDTSAQATLSQGERLGQWIKVVELQSCRMIIESA